MGQKGRRQKQHKSWEEEEIHNKLSKNTIFILFIAFHIFILLIFFNLAIVLLKELQIHIQL